MFRCPCKIWNDCKAFGISEAFYFFYFPPYNILRGEKILQMLMRLPGVEPGSIAWKAIILTVGLQTLVLDRLILFYIS